MVLWISQTLPDVSENVLSVLEDIEPLPPMQCVKILCLLNTFSEVLSRSYVYRTRFSWPLMQY